MDMLSYTWNSYSAVRVKRHKKTQFRALLGVALVALLMGSMMGCDTLLEVDQPTRVSADVLNDPNQAEAIVQGAARDFQCFHSVYVSASGLFTDEMYASTSFAETNNFDTRNIDPTFSQTLDCIGDDNYGIHLTLHRARFTNDDAVRRIQEFSDGELATSKAALLAQPSLLAGYALLFMGEGYERGVAEEEGPALSPNELFAEAIERFNSAIEHANQSGNSEVLNAAHVGRARAHLNRGEGTEAISDAEQVDEGFEMNIEYSGASPARNNQIWVENHRAAFISVEPTYRDLQTLEGQADPRVSVTDEPGDSPDGLTPYWTADKHSRVDSPIRLASWDEAQLIIAEVNAFASNPDLEDAAQRINNVREEYGLPEFSSANAEEVRQEVIEEQMREFFLEGWRLGQKRRLGLAFKQGLNHKETFTYGDITAFPLAQAEVDANPNISE